MLTPCLHHLYDNMPNSCLQADDQNDIRCSQMSQDSTASTPKVRRHVSVPVERVTTPNRRVVGQGHLRVDSPRVPRPGATAPISVGKSKSIGI